VRDAARLRIQWSDLDARSVLIIVTSITMVIIATRGVVRSVDPETYGSHGLIAAAPYGYHLALALVLAAFVYNLWRERFSQLCAAVSVVSTLFLLHGVLPLVYGTPRFGWSPKYVGVIEYAIDNHAFNRNIDAYHNWPGFFTVAAQFSDLVDVRPLSYAPWA
jgi:hypothetical protein